MPLSTALDDEEVAENALLIQRRTTPGKTNSRVIVALEVDGSNNDSTSNNKMAPPPPPTSRRRHAWIIWCRLVAGLFLCSSWRFRWWVDGTTIRKAKLASTTSSTHNTAAAAERTNHHYPSTVFLAPPTIDDASYFGTMKHHNFNLKPMYGGLAYHSIQQADGDEDSAAPAIPRSRQIDSNDSGNYNLERFKFLEWMEEHDLWSKTNYDNWEETDHSKCLEPKWKWDKHPSCLAVHEALSYSRAPSPHQLHEFEYLSSGVFRDTFLFTPVNNDEGSGGAPVVVKSQRYDREVNAKDMYQIASEANLMEKLSPSPHTSNLYGYCGSSILVEKLYDLEKDVLPYRRGYKKGRIPQVELDKLQKDDVYPMNKDRLTVEQKLDLAISMAEGLAELHGFPGGVVVMDDIDPGQWLRRTQDDYSSAILNDVNNAVYLAWSETKNEYCKYWRSFGGRNRAPEEYDGANHDESVDIWPFGNAIFSLLTGTSSTPIGLPWLSKTCLHLFAHSVVHYSPGLNTYYDMTDSDEVQEATKKGPPYIDPRYKSRSFIEGRMVEIMNQCHKLNPRERVDIFEVVRYLRETRELYQQNKTLNNAS